MLQQTTVASVIPRFERFVERWPTIEELAAASDEAILSEWAGLGYYARARNLIACARHVVRGGGFPVSADRLKELPGIGPYTSAAIAAIAFGERAPAVDTNVERVIARLNGLTRVRRPEIERLLLAMMLNDRPGDVVQAMMDLGASICRPRKPACPSCPLRGECTAFKSGSPEGFPAPKQPRSRPHRFGVAYWTECDGNVWLVRRPERGPLGKMAALPGSEWSQAPVVDGNPIGTIHHVFTHFSLDLDVVLRSEPLGEGWWHPVEQIGRAGLPTLYRKAADLVLIHEERRAA